MRNEFILSEERVQGGVESGIDGDCSVVHARDSARYKKRCSV